MPVHGKCFIRLLVFEASLRKASLNYRLATLIEKIATEHGARVDRGHFSEFECPTFNGDVEELPPGAAAFRQRLADAHAFVIASPEYNGSVPGGLKNLIDWVSRIRPQPFNGKHALLTSASPSMVGGNRGLWALRVPLEHLGTRVYPDMFSLAQAHQAFDATGSIANATLQKRFETTIESFMDLVEAATHYPALRKQWVEHLGQGPDPEIDRVESVDVGGE